MVFRIKPTVFLNRIDGFVFVTYMIDVLCEAVLYIEVLSIDSSVGIVTHYGLGGPGIEFRCGRVFPHQSRPALRPTQTPIEWLLGVSRGLSGRGVALTTQPHPAPRLKTE